MSDTYRRYRAIKQAIMQCYTPRPRGHQEKHFNTLVALICGLSGAKPAHLPAIADHTPALGATPESVVKRFRRWLAHAAHTMPLRPSLSYIGATLATPLSQQGDTTSEENHT